MVVFRDGAVVIGYVCDINKISGQVNSKDIVGEPRFSFGRLGLACFFPCS